MATIPTEFANVKALPKANVYFNGRVVSHTILLSDGTKKTLGIIFPGQYHFKTESAESMAIVAGACEVALDGSTAVVTYTAGEQFDVPAHSGFNISVADGLCEYVCSFLS